MFLMFFATISGASATHVEDHGTIYVKINQTFNITLCDWNDAGYGAWKIKSFNKNLVKLVNKKEKVNLDGTPVTYDGWLGYNGYEIFKFKAIKPGKTEIYLKTGQIWDWKKSEILAKYTIIVIP